jgi:hypothetical protein
LALRAASGPSDAVATIERISRWLQRQEERWLDYLGRLSKGILEGNRR